MNSNGKSEHVRLIERGNQTQRDPELDQALGFLAENLCLQGFNGRPITERLLEEIRCLAQHVIDAEYGAETSIRARVTHSRRGVSINLTRTVPDGLG